MNEPDGAARGAKRPWRYRAVIALVSALALILVQREVGTWVDRTGAFMSAVALVVALALLLDWVADLVFPGLWRVLRSVGRGVGRVVAKDPELERVLGRFPRLDAWIRARLSTRSWTGWYLTATVLLVLWFLVSFAQISWQLALGSSLVAYDPRVEGLLRAMRTPELTRVMWVSTLLGDALVVTVLTGVGAGLFILWGRRRSAIYVIGAVASGAAIQTAVKLFVHRPRPPVELMLIREPASYSFPSGHAMSSLVLFGAFAFLAARSLPSVRARLVVITAAVAAVVMVGISRVYLGVHWPTDVLAGWSLGAAWLVVWSGAVVMWERYGPAAASPAPALPRGARIVTTLCVTALALGAVVYAAMTDSVLVRAVRPAAARPLEVLTGPKRLPALPAAAVSRLPRFSEKLDGSHQEPIGLIFIGTRERLLSAFDAAGWQVADRASVVTVIRAGVAAAFDQPYDTAPVTPTFLDGKVQDIAFEEAARRATVRTRHHTRFWLTGWTADGAPVWVATASFDEGVVIGSALHLPTHKIAPDIDAERDYIVADLTSTGLVAESERARVSPPLAGTNAQGDTWFTQGLAVVLVPR